MVADVDVRQVQIRVVYVWKVRVGQVNWGGAAARKGAW
jgi:hypothetical protein